MLFILIETMTTNLTKIETNRSIKMIRFTNLMFKMIDFDVILMSTFRFSHDDNVILRRRKFRILSSDSNMFIFIKNFVRRLSTTWACRFNLSILFDLKMKNFKWTYSKQLCVTISMFLIVIKLFVWKILLIH